MTSMDEDRLWVTQAKRWVIKIGSALLTNDGQGIDAQAINGWVDQIVELRKQGLEVILVSSGAVAEGIQRMGIKERPKALHDLQACAAIGQMGLVQTYETAFQRHNLHTAQLLLTHEDFASRKRYLNAQSTIETLLKMGVVPIINENDTVATDEIRLGDNDTLGALVVNLTSANILAILTDQLGLFDSNPRENPNAKQIFHARASDANLQIMASPKGGALGSGGMLTKVLAAQKAARSGGHTLIASGREPRVLPRLLAGERLGTFIVADVAPLTARKQWLSGQIQLQGRLVLDEGAVKALQEHKSLLPIGVLDSKGMYTRGDLVECVNEKGEAIARGLINYDSRDTHKIKGTSSENIENILGYVDEFELIHKDNLVLS